MCSFDPRRLAADDTSTAAALAQCAYGRPVLADGILSIASRFPRLRCLLLDGFPGIEPEALLARLPTDPSRLIRPPLLLSLARCQVELPPAFFASFYLRDLVYLDLSDMPGSLGRPLAQRTLSPDQLPSLRILKAQAREMDNAVASLLFKTFRTQLWSVDLSRNGVNEDLFEYMSEVSFPERSMRTGDFAVEGRITYPLGYPSDGGGSASFGRFCFVTESDWSRTFSHPHRHLADTPPYTPHAYDGALPSSVEPRLNGRAKARPDTADEIKAMLSGTASHPAPPLESVRTLDVCRGHEGITHMYLNGNRISAAALAKLIRSSPGQLQHLECDSLSFSLPEAAPSPFWPSRARLSGILGWAHVFRPVFSANLQVLRVHHSLVTHLLTLELDGSPPRLSPMASLWAAETLLLPRAELAYPEAFVPDMNPRLQSLVLAHIPRWSTGALIERLIRFLRLASAQERAIQDARAASRRAPATVRGLRHVRFEFAPDPREDRLEGGSDSDDAGEFDAAAVMDDSTKEFSFFGESNWSSTKPVSTTAAPVVNTPNSHPKPEPNPNQSARSASPHPPSPSFSPHPPPSDQPRPLPSLSIPPPSPPPPPSLPPTYTPHSTPPNTTLHTFTTTIRTIPNPVPITITLPVWTGPSPITPDTTPAVEEYTRLLQAHPALWTDPVPASPCHVSAGVPEGVFLFGAAWGSILCPTSLPPRLGTGGGGEAIGGVKRDGDGIVVGKDGQVGWGDGDEGDGGRRGEGRGGGEEFGSKRGSQVGGGVKPNCKGKERGLGDGFALPRPTRAQLRGMRDVLDAIKAYRAKTRQAYEEEKKKTVREGRREDEVRLGAPHFHWMGKLEVLVAPREGEGIAGWR